jgi:hypothetical protein
MGIYNRYSIMNQKDTAKILERAMQALDQLGKHREASVIENILYRLEATA